MIEGMLASAMASRSIPLLPTPVPALLPLFFYSPPVSCRDEIHFTSWIRGKSVDKERVSGAKAQRKGARGEGWFFEGNTKC